MKGRVLSHRVDVGQPAADEVPANISAPSSRRSRRSGRRGGRNPASPAAENNRRLPLPIIVFLLSLLVPWTVQIGPLRLITYRVVLLVLLFPCARMILTGKAGRLRLVDFALLGYCLWALISLTALYGVPSALESGGILFVETMGAYLLARCYIRDADTFFRVTRLLFTIVMILLPVAIIEAVTGRNLALETLSKILPTNPIFYMEPRWGLRRVQAVFDHPILFGVCCGSILAMTHLVLGYKKPHLHRWGRTALVGFSAGLSLSSGPWSAMAAQLFLLLWDRLLRAVKSRWLILTSIAVTGVVVIEIAAKRSLPNILFSYFSFDPGSAYYRILIWEFGYRSALNHPLFGVGFGEWDRPGWMTSSIDMFWLYHAIIYGLPAAMFMFVAIFAAFLPIALKKVEDERTSEYRKAYLITLIGLFQVGWMVHFWSSTYVLFLFLLGSGLWIRDVQAEEAGPRGVRARRQMQAKKARGLES